MARAITEWRDAPYIYENGFYYARRGGKPCKSLEAAYRERYKAEIKRGEMSPDPFNNAGISWILNKWTTFLTNLWSK